MYKKKLAITLTIAFASALLSTGCGPATKTAEKATSQAEPVSQTTAAGSEAAAQITETSEAASQTTATAQAATETVYPFTMTIYDADGKEVEITFDKEPERVLSTQLSMTEALIKLGLKDKIIGVFDNDNALKGEIGEEIAALNSLGDKKSVSKETIIAAEPDIILGKGPLMFTDTSIGTVQSYQELGIPVYTELASANIDQSLYNIAEDVRNIGKIFNEQAAANAYADELQERLDRLMEKVRGQTGKTQKVLFMAGYSDGSFAAFNSKMSSCMLEALNAENVLDKGGNDLTMENLISMNPDIIVYIHADRYAKTDKTAVEQLLNNTIIQDVSAIANRKVIEMNYDDIMDYGARIIDASEKLYDFMYGTES